MEKRDRPLWNRLYETAEAQLGYLTTAQAAEAGYSPQLLTKYLKNGRIARVRRGIYRLTHFPPSDDEGLVVVWLWSDRAGVFSHETALALYQLSDVLPARAHMTLPASWASRHLQPPPSAMLAFADVEDADWRWVGAVPVTTPERTVLDCARDAVSPDLVLQAIDEGLQRGLFTESMIQPARESLGEFGFWAP